MTKPNSLPTRLIAYINALLPEGHGHQRKGWSSPPALSFRVGSRARQAHRRHPGSLPGHLADAERVVSAKQSSMDGLR